MGESVRLDGIRTITLDFGNTLVPVTRASLHAVVERTAANATARLRLGDAQRFLAVWSEERERQFHEEVPLFREVDLPERAVRVLARLRGMASPPAHERWDMVAAAALSDQAEADLIVESYSTAFVAGIPAPVESRMLLEDLSRRGFRLAILSNWPLASTIDRFAATAGWQPWLDGIFVSQRIGTIKPHPAIFRFVERALDERPDRIAHVGDDRAADVAGSAAAGWRAVYLRDHQADSALPTSTPGPDIVPDLVLDRLSDLARHLADPSP